MWVEAMANRNSNSALPASVLRRLPKYLAHIQNLRGHGKEWVSSLELAEALGLTSSTVRQDVTHLECRGISKRGYETEVLEKILTRVLGLDKGRNMVIVGAGNIGRALARYGDLHREGFRICGIFDSDASLVGGEVGDLAVQAMNALPDAVRRGDVDIGVIAVPAQAAQEVAENLVGAGVRGLLNLSAAHVQVANVPVVDVRLVASLQELAFAVKVLDETGRVPHWTR